MKFSKLTESQRIRSTHSCHTEHGGNWFPIQLRGWPISAQNCAQNGQDEDFEGLLPREEQLCLQVQEQVLLDDHCDADNDPDENPKKARRQHQKQGLVEIKGAYAVACEAEGAENGNLLRLIVHVSRHGGLQREEAEEHHDQDHHVEHEVK